MHAPVRPPIPVETLLLAYRSGIFPMADQREDTEVFWVEPRERAIIPLDGLHISKSLRKVLRADRFTVTVDRAFEHVIRACAEPREDHPETWISERIVQSYIGLQRAGHAHSVECWRTGADGERALVGGLYGVSFDRVFCGESMFSRVPDASKVALAWLVALVLLAGFSLALQTTYREPNPNLVGMRQPLTSVGHVFLELILLLFGHMSAPLSVLLLTDETDPVRGAVFPIVAFGLLLAYLVVVQLVLLNLLIAYMGMTLAEIHADATNHSQWQFAAFVLEAESHLLGNWPRSPCYKCRQYMCRTLGTAQTHAGGRALYIDGSIRLPAWWSDQPEANLEPVACKFLEIEVLGDACDHSSVGAVEGSEAGPPKHALAIMRDNFKEQLTKDRDADHPSSGVSSALPAHPHALAGDNYKSAARTRAGLPKLVGYGSTKNLLCGATVGLAQSSPSVLISRAGDGHATGERLQQLDATLGSLVETLRAEIRRGIDEQMKDVASSAASAAAAAIQSQFQSKVGAMHAPEGAPLREKTARQGSLTHAAATTLIAKVVKERDEARAMLSQYREPVPDYPAPPMHGTVSDTVRQLRPLAPLQPVTVEPERPSGGGLSPRRDNGLRERLVAPGGGTSSRREESPRDALVRRRERWVRTRASGEVVRAASGAERSATQTREADYRV